MRRISRVIPISRNARTKTALKLPPRPPHGNSEYFGGQRRAVKGRAQVVLVFEDGSRRTAHCYPVEAA